MVKTTHLYSDAKRKRPPGSPAGAEVEAVESETAASEAAAGGRRRIKDGTRNRGGAHFVVGVGADDVGEEQLGQGTKWLMDLLWTLKDDKFEAMALADEKHKCPRCGKASKLYCERCVERVGDTTGVPSVRLPLEIAVVQHSSENK